MTGPAFWIPETGQGGLEKKKKKRLVSPKVEAKEEAHRNPVSHRAGSVCNDRPPPGSNGLQPKWVTRVFRFPLTAG